MKVRVFGVFYQGTVMSVLIKDGPDLLREAEAAFNRRFDLSLTSAHAVFAVSGNKNLDVRTWDFDAVAEELGHREVV